jgi:hypothetical protein
LELEGREEGVSCTQAAGKRAQQLSSCIGDGWNGSETEERESGVGLRYIRETLMGLAQINRAQYLKQPIYLFTSYRAINLIGRLIDD